jgi:hypothetical protein
MSEAEITVKPSRDLKVAMWGIEAEIDLLKRELESESTLTMNKEIIAKRIMRLRVIHAELTYLQTLREIAHV